MSEKSRREQLTNYIATIEGMIKRTCNNSAIVEQIENLKSDIQNDFFTVLVVGEFKRGKSTFVNAFLGEELMIADVLPETATIQAVMYEEKKTAEVLYLDGHKESGVAERAFFERFSAKNSAEAEQIKYIKVGYPCEILKNKIVLVDTPGVEDLNAQRVQVTYDFLPKANAVIFLLDATSPLKRTEKEFIEDHLLNRGMSNVIFVVNKMDMLDEDEVDIEAHLEQIKERIKSAFGKNGEFEEPIVLPVSSRLAVQGIATNNQEFIERSNINYVKKQLQEVLFGSSMEQLKLESYKNAFLYILDQWKVEFQREKDMLEADSEKLSVQLNNINEIEQSMVQKYSMVEVFVNRENDTLLSMVDKSLDKFRYELLEDIHYEIDRYSGQQFKEFIERDIPHLVKKRTDAWLSNKSISIEKFYHKLEEKLSYGLSRYFNKRVFIESSTGTEIRVKPYMQMETRDISGATIEAGVVTAVGAIAMTALGFGAFAPLISMAVLPSLRDSFLKNALNKSKEEIRPIIDEEIDLFLVSLRNEMQDKILKRTDEVVYNVQSKYDKFLLNYKKNMQLCIEQKNRKDGDIQEKIQMLTSNYALVEKVISGTQNI